MENDNYKNLQCIQTHIFQNLCTKIHNVKIHIMKKKRYMDFYFFFCAKINLPFSPLLFLSFLKSSYVWQSSLVKIEKFSFCILKALISEDGVRLTAEKSLNTRGLRDICVLLLFKSAACFLRWGFLCLSLKKITWLCIKCFRIDKIDTLCGFSWPKLLQKHFGEKAVLQQAVLSLFCLCSAQCP